MYEDEEYDELYESLSRRTHNFNEFLFVVGALGVIALTVIGVIVDLLFMFL